MDAVVVIGVLLFLCTSGVDGKISPKLEFFEYPAISCRAHEASLTDFGGVGDGETSNTKVFQAAIDHLSQFSSDGGSQLYVPAGRWLTGSFNLTSHFTLYLDKDAVLIASQDESEWPVIEPLPSYGRGRDTEGGRYSSLIFGTNLTDVIITGANAKIDGQGDVWWKKFRNGELNYTRPYLIEILYSSNIQISNLTLINSPSWNVHPVYSSNVVAQGLTILAPVTSPNTDGINPDSCTNTRIEDCYIVSGDDCVAVKSGWDEYGIAFGMPTKQLVIRRLTCISPFSAAIALGSEMSGGIQDVRAEDITAIDTESGVRIKTSVGRGGFVKDIYVRKMTMKTMKWVFWMTGNYGSHPDNNYDPNAIPEIKNINYRDMVAENVTMAARLEGIAGDPFTGICISNVTIGLTQKPKKLQWNCTEIAGISSVVTPKPCDLLTDQGPGETASCNFPEDGLPIQNIEVNRDGSVYSGTFHTASVDKEYGIVLKEAKLTKKGKCDANVANGNVIETLVILSGDLVQVVAKGVLFPADGFMGNIASDNVEAAVVNVPSSEILMSGAKESNKSTTDKKKVNENRNNSANGFMPTKTGKEHEEVEVLANHAATATEIEPGKRERINISKIEGAFDSAVIGRQIGDNWSKGEENHHKQFELQKEKSDNEVQSSSSISNLSLSETKVVGEGQKMTKLLPNGVSCDTTSALVKPDNQCHGRPTSAGAICSSVSTVSNTLIDVASESCSGSLHSSADVVSPQSSESSKSSKEFKLNPGAKIFCPSFATPISVSTAVPGVASMSYVPSNSPMVPIAAAQPEVGISPFIRPSVPAKFASYTNLTAVNGGNDLQFSPPIMGNRTLPRYSGQYPAVQTAPTYVPPNSQAVMVGRLGQLVYVQPVPHDLVQSGATIAPVSARPLLTQHQVQYPKHQGCITGQALQLCAPPPFVAGGQQPYAIPSHIPLLQPPIPANRPLPVPGANPFFGTKFP